MTLKYSTINTVYIAGGSYKFDEKKRRSKPTFRWILQKFQGISLLLLNGVQQIANLSEERRHTIQLLDLPACLYCLLLSPEHIHSM